MKNLYSKKLKEILENNNRFILANIDFKKNTTDVYSIWGGFSSKRELRTPRIIELPSKKTLKIWESIGFDVIVFDEKSSLQWFSKGTGRGVFHISFVEEFFPSILKPLPTLESAEKGGFYGEETEVGRRLSRRRLSKTERRKLRKEFEQRCCICNSTKDLTIHHIKDRKYGGGSERLNSVLICQTCHTKINKREIKGIDLYTLRYRDSNIEKQPP